MNSEKVVFPIKVKDVVSRLTQSTQDALQQRLSRIEIQLPPVFDLGLNERIDAVKENSALRINRELGKLFLEMFTVLKDTAVVIFPTETEAKLAETQWTKKNFMTATSAKRQIFHFSEKLEWKSLPKSQRKQLEEKKMSDPNFNLDDYLTLTPELPFNTELIVILSPQPKDYPVIQSLHQQFGMGTLILLVNPRFVWNDFLARKETGIFSEPGLQAAEEIQSGSPLPSPISSSKKRSNKEPNSEATTSNNLSKEYLRMYEIMKLFPNTFYYSPPVLANQQLMREITKNRNILLFHDKLQSDWYLFEKLSDVSSSKATATTASSNPLNAITAMMTNLMDKLDEAKTIRVIINSAKKPTEEEIIAALRKTE